MVSSPGWWLPRRERAVFRSNPSPSYQLIGSKPRAASAPIGIGLVRLRGGKLADQRVPRREMAHRIGRARVAGERVGLAATAAEILALARAAPAGFLHPVVAAKR